MIPNSSINGKDNTLSVHHYGHQNIKGMIFDKNSLCYYPLDAGPPKPQKKPSTSMGALADVVLFKLQVDEAMGRQQGYRANRQRLVNVTTKKLIRGRKIT